MPSPTPTPLPGPATELALRPRPAAVPTPAHALEPAVSQDWSTRYGERHAMRRITTWPAGIIPPSRVRIYVRNGGLLLQWWEPAQRKNVAERVNGDVIEAVARAREIERRLTEFKTSGRGGGGRLRHRELVNRFLADLNARADAGEIEPRTVPRYTSALGHYLAFTDGAQAARKYPYAAGVDRQFALAFAAFVREREVSPNGSSGSVKQRMKGGRFVFDTVRTLFEWAADPDRGGLLSDGFRNPFRRTAGGAGEPRVARDLFGEPDVTVEMAVAFLEACDDYQLRLFAPMMLYGLRASEPVFLFGEHVDGQWLRVPCLPELAHVTKGKRDKRLPLSAPLADVLGPTPAGLLYVRRSVAEGTEAVPPLASRSLPELVAEFRRRLKTQVDASPPNAGAAARRRRRVRDEVLRDTGATSYDRIEGEFQSVAQRLGWPAAATLKDLRHLFATSMTAAGMPQAYTQYLLGHSPSSEALTSYTHLNRIREQYDAAVAKELRPLNEVLNRRVGRRTTAK